MGVAVAAGFARAARSLVSSRPAPTCYTSVRPAAPHSSRGPGHRPLKAEITGSNPVCGTSPTRGPDPVVRLSGARLSGARVPRDEPGLVSA